MGNAAAGFSKAAIFLFIALSVAGQRCQAAAGEDHETAVDVELVMAVDTSASMHATELALQRYGYAAAFRSPEVIGAITSGIYGRVAVTYVEWGASNSRRIVLPWTLISSAEEANGVADRLESAKRQNLFQTSISGVIRYGVRAFRNNVYRGTRRVIDISGDGPNNQGGLVTVARDAAIRDGITINGLPLMIEPGELDGEGLPPLDRYYADCVIGGPRAFILPVRSWEMFPVAVRLKLTLELASGGPLLHLASSQAAQEVHRSASGTTDCAIGERLRTGSDRDQM